MRTRTEFLPGSPPAAQAYVQEMEVAGWAVRSLAPTVWVRTRYVDGPDEFYASDFCVVFERGDLA